MNDRPTSPYDDKDRDVPMEDDPTRLERLISRIVDAAASEVDWTEFRRLASKDETLWQELAEAQAQHQQLTRAVEPILAIADDVCLPVVIREEASPTVGIIRWPAWAGWAVAALVAVMWWTNGGWTPSSGGVSPLSGPGQQAGLTADWADFSHVETTPNDLLANYLQADHVVGQGALQAIGTIEPPDGTQVLIMRPIYERVYLEPKYLEALNEQGDRVPLRVPRSPGDLVEDDYAL